MDSTRIAGIVMECNPFHQGHQYILSQARAVTHAAAVLVVMSGDYVQRGIPAVFSKELRARTLLNSGADLVLELPVKYAVSSAEAFACASVSILTRLGIVTDLVFGSESGDLEHLLSAASFLNDEPADYRRLLRRHLSAGLSFPAARERAAAECSAHVQLSAAANDILGTEYLKALLPSLSLQPHAIPRIRTASATERRRVLEISKDASCLFPDDFSDLLLGKLLDICHPQPGGRHPACQHPFAAYDGISPDFSDRIERLLPEFISWTQFCRVLKAKNMTYSAVSRAMMHILLGIRKAAPDEGVSAAAGTVSCSSCTQKPVPDYVRILGCRKEAASLIGRICRNSDGLAIVTGLSENPHHLSDGLRQDLYASELYDYVARRKQYGKILPADRSAGRISEYSKPFLLL